MNEVELLSAVAGKVPFVASALMVMGSLNVLATLIVGLTPTKKDDELLAKLEAIPVLGKIWSAFKAFSLIQKK